MDSSPQSDFFSALHHARASQADLVISDLAHELRSCMQSLLTYAYLACFEIVHMQSQQVLSGSVQACLAINEGEILGKVHPDPLTCVPNKIRHRTQTASETRRGRTAVCQKNGQRKRKVR